MRFRIRYIKTTKIVEVSEDCTLDGLKNKILDENIFDNISSTATSFDLSLNGKTRLSDNYLQSVADVGLISGDLIKIILIDPTESTGQLGESTSFSHCAHIIASSSTKNIPSGNVSMMSVNITTNSNDADEVSTSSSGVPRPYISPGVHLLQDMHSQQRPPDMLQILFEHLQEQFELFCACLHTLMLESGFKDATSDDPLHILHCFHGCSWSMEYRNNAVSNALRFTLTCTSLGPFALVNGLVSPCENTQPEPLTLQIKPDEFLCKFISSSKPQTLLTACKNTSKLSRFFKENIAHPAVNCMREELQLPPIHGLLSLFPEIMMRIMLHLDAKSLCRISQTCQSLQMHAESDALWKAIYLRDFKNHPYLQNNIKKAYCEKYKTEKALGEERDRQRREFEERDIFGGPHIPLMPGQQPFPMFPGQPAGIIGGEYDRRPTFPFGPFGGDPFQSGGNPNRPNPFPVHPTNPDNPLPGSRYDPMYPGSAFRPGRGGGLQDDDLMFGVGVPTRRSFNRRRQPPDMPPFM